MGQTCKLCQPARSSWCIRTMKHKQDSNKYKKFIATVLWSGLLTYFARPYIHGNQDAINIITTIFSILAGFLVAIITVIGDPASLPKGSWRAAKIGSDLTYNRLIRKKWLFFIYILTLIFVFIGTLIKGKNSCVEFYIEVIYTFLAINAFIASLMLPSALMHLQQERIEQEIIERKKKEGIDPDE